MSPGGGAGDSLVVNGREPLFPGAVWLMLHVLGAISVSEVDTNLPSRLNGLSVQKLSVRVKADEQ